MAGASDWLSTRSMMAFAGGTMAAVIATRLLPPVFASAVGSARAAMGGDPFEALAEDHRHFIAMLTRMERSSESGGLNRMQLLLRMKRRLTAHALAEEDVIYPMLNVIAGEEEDARNLYAEHAEIKMHLHALEQLAPAGGSAWLERVRELKTLLAEHARQEEERDFPRLRENLDEQAIQKLSAHVHREKALVL